MGVVVSVVRGLCGCGHGAEHPSSAAGQKGHEEERDNQPVLLYDPHSQGKPTVLRNRHKL